MLVKSFRKAPKSFLILETVSAAYNCRFNIPAIESKNSPATSYHTAFPETIENLLVCLSYIQCWSNFTG